MNKLIPSTVISCLMATSVASAGWYAGINLGPSFVNTKKELFYPLGGPATKQAQYSPGYVGFHGQLNGGYDLWRERTFGLGIEGDIDYNSGKSQSIINNYFLSFHASTEEQLKTGYGFYLLPTWHQSPDVSIFIGPGASRTKFRVNSALSTGGNLGVSGVFDSWYTGYGLKAGVNFRVVNNVDLIMTYQFTDYNAKTLINIEPLSNVNVQGKYSPCYNSVLFGFKVFLS